MRKKDLVRIAAVCMAAVMTFNPMSASAASLIKRGSSGSNVKMVQTTLQDLGYFNYSAITGYFGSITEKAVKLFQKDHGISADGIIGSKTSGLLFKNTSAALLKVSSTSNTAVKSATVTAQKTVASNKKGALDWFSKVQYIFARGDVAKVTDIDTGTTFYLKRTYGTNHADCEPLTYNDTKIIKNLYGGFSWTRHAVVVEVNGYVLAGSLAPMPHAGVDSAPADAWVSGRSGGYGYGENLDAIKDNGVSGVMDLHFKGSRTHGTNSVNAEHQAMVQKAARYIAENY